VKETLWHDSEIAELICAKETLLKETFSQRDSLARNMCERDSSERDFE